MPTATFDSAGYEMEHKPHLPRADGLNGRATPRRRLKSGEIFGPTRRIEIEHKGEIYTLSITRQDKLILTK